MLWSHQPMYLGIAPSTTRYINFLENEAWTIGHARPGAVVPSQSLSCMQSHAWEGPISTTHVPSGELFT